jgi:hypothetical protein
MKGSKTTMQTYNEHDEMNLIKKNLLPLYYVKYDQIA